jgi:ArsR family transcriptional regulator
VSHHLKVLLDVGVLTRDKRGIWAYYRIVPEALRVLREALRYEGAAYEAKPE